MKVFEFHGTLSVARLARHSVDCQSLRVFDRTKPPELGPPPRVSLAADSNAQLPNGLKLMIVEQHELPLATSSCSLEAEATRPRQQDRRGESDRAMLREGTTTRKSLDIADQIILPRDQPVPVSSWESSTLSLHTPTAQLDSALALFADVALHPSFPANEFERIKKNRLTELLQLEGSGAGNRQSRVPGNHLWERASIRRFADRNREHR
jgi:hypothetical protein